MKNTLLVLLALLTFSAAAAADSTAGRSPSAEGARLSFANLSDGDVVPPVFTVRFALSGMAVSPAGTPAEFTGHHHLLIDLAELPPLDRPLPMTDQIRHFGKGQTETELSLPPGQHTLQLLLADHAHIPHEPPVLSERITITVQTGATPPAAAE